MHASLQAPPAAIPRPAAPVTSVSPDNAPSPRLPGVHFAAALAFFLAGALGLVLVADELATGSFFVPRIVAVVHLFVLGWIILSIFGALCQFLPVAVGQRLRWEPLAYAGCAAHVGGIVCFVSALVGGNRGLLYVGAALLSFSFVSFAINLAATLLRASERPLTWWTLAGTAIFLVITPAYGVALAMNLHGDAAIAERFATVAAHAHAGIIGIVFLVMVGVAHRLLPMFLLSHGASERPAWISLALLFAGALVLSAPWGGGPKLAVAFALIAMGAIAFLVQGFLFFKHRMRKAIDPGMRLAAAGLIGIAIALLIAPFALGRGVANLQLLVGYFVALLGAISLFVAGHYYKIVPFIVWYHRFGPLVGIQKVPKVAELYSEKLALLNGALLVAGWLGLVGSAFAGFAPGLRGAAVFFVAGALMEIAMITAIARRKPA